MKVKIFQDNGKDGIASLERTINDWLSPSITVHHIKQSMCQIGDAENGERYQHMVISIWYTEKP